MGNIQTILIVLSDEQTIQLFERYILSNQQVNSARSCEEGLTAFHAATPDLVLVSDEFGKEACAKMMGELKKTHPMTPVILLCQKDSDFSTLDAMRIGMADRLTLPTSREAIARAIQRVTDRQDHFEIWLRQEARKATGPLIQQMDELESLANLGRTITSRLNIDQVLNEVLDAALTITNAEQGSILLLDDKSGELYMRAARNFQEDFVHTFRLPTDDTYAGQVIQTGEPLFLQADAPQKIKTSYLVHSLAYVPLIYHGRTIGVLGVDNRQSNKRLNQQHISTLSTMADYAAIAIENAELYTQTEQERNKLAAILTQIKDGVIVLSEDGLVLMVNPVVRKLFNLDSRTVENQPYTEVFTNQDLLQAIQGTSPNPDRIEIEINEDLYYRARVTRIENVGKVISLHDISYLKELDQLKTEFVHTVSHDLRSPLTTILGYVDLIKRVGEVNATQDDYIGRVQASVRQISNLISEVLDLGKIEGRMSEFFELTSLEPIIQGVLADHQEELDTKGQRVEVLLSGNFPAIYTDPTQIRQMFENLLGNAIKYTPKAGTITVSGWRENDQVIIRVKDTGRGIPLDEQTKIFDRFYRGKNVVDDTQGTGLGLAITKTIVENHQGRIWVNSKENEGSTFTIVLPMRE